MKIQLMDAVLAPIDLYTVASVWADEKISDNAAEHSLCSITSSRINENTNKQDTEKIEKLTKQLQDADMQLDDYKHDLNNLTNEMEHANKEREAYKNHCRILLKKIDRIKKATKGTAVSYIGDTKTECDNLFKCWEDEIRARNTADRKYNKLLHTIEGLTKRYTDESEAIQCNSDVESRDKGLVLQNILTVLRYLKNKANNQQ